MTIIKLCFTTLQTCLCTACLHDVLKQEQCRPPALAYAGPLINSIHYWHTSCHTLSRQHLMYSNQPKHTSHGPILTWAQLRIMPRHRHCTIGAISNLILEPKTKPTSPKEYIYTLAGQFDMPNILDTCECPIVRYYSKIMHKKPWQCTHQHR